jgi:FtsH-binding integral membrane protein
VEHLGSWIKASTYLVTLLLITICDENDTIIFSLCNLILLLLTGIVFLGGLFFLSIQPEKSSFGLNLSIFLIVISSLGITTMGYLTFVRNRNDIQGFVSLMNDLIYDLITDIAELREKLPKLQSQPQTQSQPPA